jgi:hypothetical protein
MDVERVILDKKDEKTAKMTGMSSINKTTGK